MLSGNVLVTGGAGFLGRGIIRRALRENWDARIVVLSRDDSKHAALQRRYPEIECVLGDVGLDTVDRLASLMRGFDTVIHAAASKYVDRSERAAIATVQTNVIGTMRVAEAASRARVRDAVVISTDKACAPVNNYGATKLLAERIFQEADRTSATRFVGCRYGNVVGSTGSVIPLFIDWVAEGKPIRLTDPRMTRFWMGVEEAIDVIIRALDRRTPGGTIVIPSMRASTMKDLARMALGYNENGELPEDGRVEIIGIRPGEKRHEAIVHMTESVRCTRQDDRYYHLAAPDSDPTNPNPFEITSNAPPGGGIPINELRHLVEDAADV